MLLYAVRELRKQKTINDTEDLENSGLYYKHIAILIDAASVVSK